LTWEYAPGQPILGTRATWKLLFVIN